MLILLLLAAASPDRCQTWGEWLLLSAPARVIEASNGLIDKAPTCERYLRASALIALEAPEAPAIAEARGLFDGLAAQPSPLGDYAKLQRARIAFYTHEAKHAPPAASAAFAGGDEYALLTLLLGPTLADAMYDKVNIAGAPEVRRLQLELLAEYAAAKNPSWTDKVLRELFVEYPDSPKAPLVFAEATLQDLLRRAQIATDKHMNADVLKTVAAARGMKPGEGQLCALAFFEGAAQRKLRKYAAAESALLDAGERCGKALLAAVAGSADAQAIRDFRKRAHYLIGQVQIIARPLPTAQATLQRFASEYGNDSLVDDALFGIAVALAKAGLADDAIAAYERVAKLDPPGDMCAEAAFRIAYGHYKAGRYQPALERFAKIADGGCGADEYERTRGAYWDARTRERLKQKAPLVEKALARVIELQPMSYYAMLARLRLGAKAPKLAVLDSKPATMEAEWDDPALERSRALAAAGLFREAQQELDGLEAKAPADGLLAVARALAEAKQHHKASMLFRTALRARLSAAPRSADDAAWRIAYPRPFADEIAAAEKKEGLEPDFLLSLIREESAFQLDAGSWANAFGLTQLLVETAEATARDMKKKEMPTAEQLRMDPGLAITLGAHHLAMLKRRQKHPALILASYNAGPTNVSKWIESRGTKPMDEFVEEIPLDETRGYVKRIMRTWTTYRLLAGKPTPAFDLTPVSSGG
ncbi:MAG: transglycosylase SLT domain-containing protein [Deltaproteobacteria bacterium]|nr:transglycosylase SLT domain-containing protein [Deltaproteobacteria bacterium]